VSYQITFKDNCICLESVAVCQRQKATRGSRHPLAGSPAAGHGPDGPGRHRSGVTVLTSKKALWHWWVEIGSIRDIEDFQAEWT